MVKKGCRLSKSSFVLRALKILGPEEVLKLSQVLHTKQVPLKKAAGDDLIVWDDAPEAPTKNKLDGEGKVLAFPKKKIGDKEHLSEDDPPPPEEMPSQTIHFDLMLLQREISKTTGENLHRLNAFKGYQDAKEVFVVKEISEDGKCKTRFAIINGVLVNKKQA